MWNRDTSGTHEELNLNIKTWEVVQLMQLKSVLKVKDFLPENSCLNENRTKLSSSFLTKKKRKKSSINYPMEPYPNPILHPTVDDSFKRTSPEQEV